MGIVRASDDSWNNAVTGHHGSVITARSVATEAHTRRRVCIRAVYLTPDFRFGCGTFGHPISRHALIVAGFQRKSRPRRVTPSG